MNSDQAKAKYVKPDNSSYMETNASKNAMKSETSTNASDLNVESDVSFTENFLGMDPILEDINLDEILQDNFCGFDFKSDIFSQVDECNQVVPHFSNQSSIRTRPSIFNEQHSQSSSSSYNDEDGSSLQSLPSTSQDSGNVSMIETSVSLTTLPIIRGKGRGRGRPPKARLVQSSVTLHDIRHGSRSRARCDLPAELRDKLNENERRRRAELTAQLLDVQRLVGLENSGLAQADVLREITNVILTYIGQQSELKREKIILKNCIKDKKKKKML